MARKSKEVVVENEVTEEAPVSQETSVEEVVETEAPVIESPREHTYASFLELIEKYKEQNPVKYEAKKDILLAKLKSLK
jgi:hypothetical protein